MGTLDSLPAVGPSHTDTFAQLIGDPSVDVELAISQIPAYFGTSEMATFLAYRSLGFPVRQALQQINRPPDYVQTWIDNCPEFVEFEFKYLPKLQRVLSKNIVRLTMMRNMMLCMSLDGRLLDKVSEVGLEELTKKEEAYLHLIRPRYTSSDLLAMEKIISPEDYMGGDAVIYLTWNTREEVIEVKSIPEISIGNRNTD